MKTTRMLAVVAALWSGALSAEENTQSSDWMSLDAPQNSLGLRLGTDSEEQNLMGGDVDFALPRDLRLYAEYAHSQVDAQPQSSDSDYWAVGISSDPIRDWSLALDYRRSETDSRVETNDWEIIGRYFPGGWLLQVGYIVGEVQADNPFSGGFRNRPDTVDYDRSGLSLAYYWYLDAWSFGLEARVFDYEQSLPEQLVSSRLGSLIAQQTLSGLFDLVDHSASVSVAYQWQSWSLLTAVSQYEYAMTQTEEHSLSARVNYSVSDALSVAGLTAMGFDDDIVYGEVAVRWHW